MKDEVKFPVFNLRRYVALHEVLPFERGTRPRDHLYASELGSCARAVWYNWNYPELRENDGFSETRGALGHAIETVMKKQLGSRVVADEVSFYDEARHISGRVDFVVRLTRSGPMIPVEVKSTYAYDKFLNRPLTEHLYQLRYYLTQMPDAPSGLLVYYCLSNWGGKSGCWEALEVPRDDDWVFARAALLWKAVHATSPPHCEHEQDPEPCFACSVSAETRLKGRAVA